MSQSQENAPPIARTSHGSGIMTPYAIASTKGGHCFTVRISRPWISECAFAGIARNQSGSAPRAGYGRGRYFSSAGSQRKIMRMVKSLLAMPKIGRALKHDPEKWTPVFRKDHAQTWQ